MEIYGPAPPPSTAPGRARPGSCPASGRSHLADHPRPLAALAFPPAHLLIGAAVAEVARAPMRDPPPRRAAWAVGAMLAVAPDSDIVLGLLLGRGGTFHGTFTHSIAAVVVWALIGHAFGGWRWAAISGSTYASHLVVDLLDETGPTNLMLGWPFTGTHPYAIAPLFPRVPVKGNGPWDALLNVLHPGPLRLLVEQTLLAAAIAGGLLVAAALLRRLSATNAAPSP